MSGSLAEFKVLYKGATPGAMRKHLKRVKEKAYMAAGVLWHQQFREKHFTVAGGREYHYRPRKGQPGSGQSWWAKGRKGRRFRSYTNRKHKEKGHVLPLVWSGVSEKLTRIRDVRAKATAKKTKMQVILHSPGLNRRHPKSEIDMRDEVTRVSSKEQLKLVDRVETTLHRKLAKIRDRKTKKL